jgi:xanthine dehydrogenase accessory factor
MNDWLRTLVRRLETEDAVVRVVMTTVRGSAPREAGACMLVGAARVDGTIGGGHLEWKALEIARGMLHAAPADSPRVDRFVLGATLGQCCGGAVELLFERIGPADLPFFRAALTQRRPRQPALITTTWPPVHRTLLIGVRYETLIRVRYELREGRGTLVERIDTEHVPLWLFGAGHVGQAIVRTLAELPFDVTWIDERADIFPASPPENTVALASEFPVEAVAEAPADAMYLVLTHRHDLDFELCRAILARDDARWVGVIGSATKAASFRKRLARCGVPPERIARLVSPIGIEGIASKLPAAIAVAVAAQLLQVEARAAANSLTQAATQSLAEATAR